MKSPPVRALRLCATWLIGAASWHYVPRASVPLRNNVLFSRVREFDIGYIMGLVVGEGSFTADRKQPYLQVKLHVRDPFPLRHLAEQLGGRVYGPYRHQTRHYYTWLLRGPALRASIPIFRAYLPESWKREQFERWLEQHSDFFALDRGAAVPSAPISDVDRRGV
jgi:hypothetical protein